MTNELTALFDYFEKDKGMSREKVIEAVERALLSAAKKRLGPLREMRVSIDPIKGDMRVFTKPLVVETVTNKWEQLPVDVAQKSRPARCRVMRWKSTSLRATSGASPPRPPSRR
jgi:transcription termination/antitermination protein NusA